MRDYMKNSVSKIEIQCPDCGTILTQTETREWYIKECKRALDEKIRERSGF